jgi:peptidyl-prolyl cis-trans isomerase SurA|tara:strand:- start:726 stop:2012 length:1287 start_codon:yes stop_codon:yes gene_type:complete
MTSWPKIIKECLTAASVGTLWSAVLILPALAETVDRIVARVNSEIVTQSAVEERSMALSQQLNQGLQNALPTGDALMQQALDNIIEEKLKIQEAKKLGLEVDEENVTMALDDIKEKNSFSDSDFEALLERDGSSLENYKAIIRDQILASRVTQMELGRRAKVTDRQIKRYYNRNRKNYWEAPKVRARHILFIIDKKTPKEDIRLKEIKALKILRRVRAGEDFVQLAKKHSEDVSAHLGGDIGTIERGKMVKEFENAVFRLKAGEVSEIVRTPYGLHIIKCDEVFPGKTKNFDEVREEIRARLFLEKQNKTYKDWIGDLREKAFIEVSLFEKQHPSTITAGEKEELPTTRLSNDNFSSEDGLRGKMVKSQSKKNFHSSSARQPSLSSEAEPFDPQTIEKRLKYFKRLRDSNKISESEYQKRKKELLHKL